MQPTPAPRRISPYVLGSLYYSIYWGAFGIFEPFLNVYFQRLNISGFQIGVINSLLPLMALLVSPFVSAQADRNAWRRRILFFACLGLAALYFLLGLANDFVTVLICFVFISLLRSPTQPIGDALVLRLSSRYGIDYGRMRLWGSFFFAALSVVFGFVWERVEMRWMFPVTAAAFLLVAFTARGMEESEPVVKKSQSPWKLILGNKVLLFLFFAAVLMGASTNIFLFSSMYMAHLGGEELMIGLLLGATAMTEVPFMLYGGRLMRRLGGMQTLLLAFGLYGAAYLSGIIAWSPLVLIFTGILNGAGFGLAFIAIVVTFDQHAPDNWSASVQALVSAGMFGVAPFISAFAYGAIYDAWPAGVYAFSALLILLATVALLAAIRFEKKETGNL